MSAINMSPQGSESKLMPSLSFIIVFGVIMIAGALALTLFVPSILPPPASTQAEQIDQLFTFLLFVGGAIFILVEGVLLVAIIRYRAKPGERGDGVPVHGNRTLEAVWTGIPAIIVTVLAVYSWVVWNNTHAVAANEQTVAVVGARYAWTFNYQISREDIPANLNYDLLKPEIQADLSDEDGVIRFSYPQLHTWVGQPVVVEMTAQDVNHAFWVPAMRVKQDVLVGRTTEVRFTPTQTGSFRIVCAELCGAGHGNMAGQLGLEGEMQGAWVIVHASEEDYLREFFEPEATTVLLPPEDPALVGRQILISGKYPCATCHVLDDLAWAGNVGPNLNGIGDRAVTRADQSGQADAAAYLIHSIRQPGAWLVPGFGNLMPQFNPDEGQPNYMPDSDLNAIVAYLLTQTAAAQ
jgi:cytochrome c oxidase subunit 2